VAVTVRVSTGYRLQEALAPHVPVHLIGDARNPRDVGAAVQEAYAVVDALARRTAS
jgi:hypothetical protein